MSVDIMIEALSTGAYTFTCYGPGYDARVEHGPFNGRDVATAAIADHKTTCVECDVYDCYPDPVLDVDMSINLSNANAVMLLGVLGIEVDHEYGITGGMDAEQFLGHVMVAMATDRDSAAVPAVDMSSGRGARMIDCGLPAGYVDTMLGAMADIATEAMRLGRPVTWG